MSNAVEVLMEMGFTKERAELAVEKTTNDVQSAMDWLLSHEEELDQAPQVESSTVTESPGAGPAVADQSAPVEEADQSEVPEAKSVRCDDCGKLFKTTEEVEYHASKSGHSNFSESSEEKKPLSDEEKKEQLAKIEAKLKQRRLEREAREKEEALAREKNRIRSGKEMLEAKKKQEELEMKKIVDQRKREKEDERLARQRVRDQIEQDKLARKAKFGGGLPAEVEPSPVVQPQKAAARPATNYLETRLQIKMPDGEALVQTFGVKEPLSAVRVFVAIKRDDFGDSFKLMTNFPRHVFTDEDYDKPLEILGLAPSSTLFVIKR